MPRKTFEANEILTAAETNLYLSNERVFTSSTATSYSLTEDDRYSLIQLTSGSAITVSLSTSTGFIPGENVDIIQDGTGVVTITAGTGVTLAGAGTATTSFTMGLQYEAASIVCVDTDTYRVIGNITAVE